MPLPRTEPEEGAVSERLSIEDKYHAVMSERPRLGRLVSYVGNKTVPILRLYRFKEAFSLGLVNHFLDEFEATPRDFVFDPFAGMGTTLFGAMLRGLPSLGIDRLPVAAFISRTLPKLLLLEPGSIASTFRQLEKTVDEFRLAAIADDVSIMKSAFEETYLIRLRQWKAAIDSLSKPYQDIFTLLFLSILESTSYASNDGQFLRLKSHKKLMAPDEALLRKVLQAEADLIAVQHMWFDRAPYIENLPISCQADARDLSNVEFPERPTIVVTSPPYPNRYDYSRSYCLELCFSFVKSFEELKAVRFGILRSHIEAKAEEGDKPCHPVVAEVMKNLEGRKLNNPRIPIMLTAYFVDMEKCIREWSRVLAPGAKVAMVVDNVRFEGQLVPVDLVLSDIAERYGFQVNGIVVARYKGNSSQQMGRYGRIPVRESVVLWSKP
jgi:site-specific DNA-methyltransferase (cytosine-N4-specific)